ncbi:uncharacterized protein LY89DRAFT_742453 [Mollisia scopiformis]|uniref:BZIP domain-containing protein n=1 Tax=Mollisia scopiformis TaxID=149040 RepID=A0A132B600_MOLSC|nr:uncharacterized protein LY89DRAFT_742453 [Mollisia scopiformis]KUJ07683.1 hypothetical protein LY89DRAFT_742453 [Mollisia scopiformis]
MSDRVRTSDYKQARKESAAKDNDTQRERKRALDRKAQRASREKTRSYIAHLERTVQILSERNGTAAANELLEEISKLHVEVDRLKKIIEGIRCLLGVDLHEAPVTKRPSSQSSVRDSTSSNRPIPDESGLCEVRSPSADPSHLQKVETQDGSAWTTNIIDEELAVNEHIEGVNEDISQRGSTETYHITQRPARNLDWMDFDETDPNISARSQNILHHGSLPSIMRSLTPTLPEYEPCEVWKKANAIYARIFNFDRQKIAEADQIDGGSLVRVVKDGWNSLSVVERSNPVIEILREVDQYLFWDLDPVTKVANLYKSMLILKYYFNAGSHNLEKMPEWQRPVQSQKSKRHPLAIDFFPWPALRDRLVRQHNYYFGTTDFSVNYRHHFKFSWPFNFDDIYAYDHKNRSYQLSPLFERYHQDVRCWSLQKAFFDKFPEFIGEISAFEDEVSKLPASSIPGYRLSPARDRAATFQEAPNARNANHEFADDIMQLFDECPPT